MTECRCRIVYAVEPLESRMLLSTLYVGPTGNDSTPTPTNPATPYRTIQKATTVVNAGDTVIVQPGVYYGPINLTRVGTSAAPITFKADAIGQNRVVITNANQAIREKTISWTLVDSALKMYTVPMDHFPERVLYDGVDLLPYQSLAQLQAFRMGVNLDYPGTPSGYFFDSSLGKLYVRLRADGKYGSVDPNQHIMAVAPPPGGGGKGYDIGTSGTLYNFGITPQAAAYVVLDGFSFETPGVAGVYVRGSNVTVRNSWFRGVKTGVAGRRSTPDNDTYSADNVLVEYCDYSQFPAYDDAIEIIHQWAPTWFDTPRDGDWKFFWWQRKGQSDDKWLDSNFDYESPGITEFMGRNWIIRNNRMADVFDGIGTYAMEGMDGAQIYNNVFERMVDNAIEFENHGRNIALYNNEFRDIFMPISWQPLGGTPWPTNIFVYRNVIKQSDGFGAMWKDEGRYRGAWLKIGAAEKQWAWYDWMNGTTGTVPKSPVDPGEQGVWFYNNTIVTRASQFLEKINSNSMEMIGVNFYNNIFVNEDWYGNYDISSNYWTMTFSHNVRSTDVPAAPITENHIAGTGGVTLRDPAQIGFVNLAGGNYSLTSSSPARGLGVAVPNRSSSEWSTDAGAIPYGTSWVTPTVGPQSTVDAAAPTDLNAATASTSQVNLTWTDHASNETGFRIDYTTSFSFASGVTTILLNTPNAASYNVTGLTAATQYYLRVRAILSGGGETANSNIAAATTRATAPTGLSAAAVSSNQIDLTWTAPPGIVSGYNLYRGTTAGGQGSTPINSSPITSTSYSDTGLPPNSPFFYKVAAVNAGGTGAVSNEANATTQAASQANYIDFDVASDYTNNFREVGGYIANLGWDASGVVAMSHTQNWRTGVAIYDRTPGDGQTTIDTFGGTTLLESHSMDFQINTSGMVKLFARVANPSVNGGYYLYAGNAGNSLALRIPTSAASPDNEVDLSGTAYSFQTGVWYTLVFTLQNNAGNTAVSLSGKLFTQGNTFGTPLATVSYVHSASPYTAAGQIGFAATSGGTAVPTASTNIDNFQVPLTDTVPPRVLQSSYGYGQFPHTLSFTFSENVWASLSVSDLSVQNLGSGAMATVSGLSYDAVSNTATFSLAGLLADGNYRATLGAGGISDVPGNGLDGDGNGSGGDDFTSGFFFLRGDANHDRVVDITDLGILATNWQGSGKTFAQGDFNYDGLVDISDLGILASNWQKSVAAPALPLASAGRSRVAARSVNRVIDLLDSPQTPLPMI